MGERREGEGEGATRGPASAPPLAAAVVGPAGCCGGWGELPPSRPGEHSRPDRAVAARRSLPFSRAFRLVPCLKLAVLSRLHVTLSGGVVGDTGHY